MYHRSIKRFFEEYFVLNVKSVEPKYCCIFKRKNIINIYPHYLYLDIFFSTFLNLTIYLFGNFLRQTRKEFAKTHNQASKYSFRNSILQDSWYFAILIWKIALRIYFWTSLCPYFDIKKHRESKCQLNSTCQSKV